MILSRVRWTCSVRIGAADRRGGSSRPLEQRLLWTLCLRGPHQSGEVEAIPRAVRPSCGRRRHRGDCGCVWDERGSPPLRTRDRPVHSLLRVDKDGGVRVANQRFSNARVVAVKTFHGAPVANDDER